MTIEAILPWVLSECGLDVEAPDISAQDYQMRQILALMNAAGKDINTRAEWSGAMATLLIAGDAVITFLPSDFQKMTGAGAMQAVATNYSPIRPVVDETMYRFLANSTPSTPYYHIAGGFLYFLPAVPASGATASYISNNWVSGKDAITENADQPVFPEELLARGTIWRWRRQKGLPYDHLMAEFEADLQIAFQSDRGAA